MFNRTYIKSFIDAYFNNDIPLGGFITSNVILLVASFDYTGGLSERVNDFVEITLAPYLNWLIAQRGGQRMYDPPFKSYQADYTNPSIPDTDLKEQLTRGIMSSVGFGKALQLALADAKLGETETHRETVSESYNDSKTGTSSNTSNAQQFKSFPVIPAGDPSETNPIDNKVGANVGTDTGSTTDTTEGGRDTQRDNSITRSINTREDNAYILGLLKVELEKVADLFIEQTASSGVFHFDTEHDTYW